jgi:mevalonate pyrophosphate decarboxylase
LNDNKYFKVESTTNFAIEAGLASSVEIFLLLIYFLIKAAGFAAISYGLGSLFKLKDLNDIIRIARIGLFLI